MLVKDLIAKLLQHSPDKSIHIYDKGERFDFDLDFNFNMDLDQVERSNQIYLKKFEHRVLTIDEKAFIFSASNATGISDDVLKRMLTTDARDGYDPDYNQAYDLYLVWNDAISYAKKPKELT